MVLESIDYIFKHAWNDVALANLKKYPNPARPEVVGVDVIKREFDMKSGVLKQTRLITIKGSLPEWLQKILRIGNKVYMYEESVTDPSGNSMVLKTKNLCWNQILEWEETCTYKPHHENPSWTAYKHEANFTAFPYGVKSSIEHFAAQSFRANAFKGRDIMEQVILKLKQETFESLALAEEMGSKFKIEAEESIAKTKVAIEDLVNNDLLNVRVQ